MPVYPGAFAKSWTPRCCECPASTGQARNPDGDTIECDVLNGTANTVLPSLRRLQVDRRGSIVIEPVELAISGRTTDAATQQLGAGRQRPGLGGGRGRIGAGDLTAPVAVNIVVLIVVGVLTPRFVRLLWRRISNRHDQNA